MKIINEQILKRSAEAAFGREGGLSDLGITKSLSRPYVSNDNPFSEAQFKTMKHRPNFPHRFNSLVEARMFCRSFFEWYNQHHYHSGIGYLTPASVHYGFADEILANRFKVLIEAYHKIPERFRYKPPKPNKLPKFVWINKPDSFENKV